MNPLKNLILGLSIFLFSANVQAQSFSDFSTLFDNLGEQQQQDFFDQLSQLDINELSGYLQSCGAIDRLRDLLNGDLPFDEIGDLMGTFENAGIYIDEWLGSLFGLSDEDQDALFGQFGDIEDAFGNNFDDLSNAFDIYGDSINGLDPGIQIGTDLNLDLLEDNFQDQFGNIDPNDPSSISDIFGQIFDQSLFSDLEIAYGRKAAVVGWYGTEREIGMENLQVIKVGTVPSFDSDFEPYWGITASWSNNKFGLLTGSEGNATDTGFDPFIFEGEFGLSYNPGLNVPGITGGRLITRLGFESGTYAPPHIMYGNEATYDNVGKTTGCGPQIATGYSVTTGNLITYVLASASYGVVSNCPYPYTNLKLEAGARFGDAIHVKYSMGEQNWAHDGNKSVNTLSQFTVGILIDELFN